VKLLASVVAGALALAPGLASAPAPPTTIDLSKFMPTFSEEFGRLSVSAWGDGKSRWIAHTPWAGDFGDAQFADPEPDFPFTVRDGVLRIEARKGSGGKWRAGLLSALDPKNKGFCQRYGYFEVRMKLPPGKGLWPAFWLIGRDKSKGSPEIDVIEYYGHDDSHYKSTWHVWPTDPSKTGEGGDITVEVPAGSLTTQFHTYGAEITEDYVAFYLDRKETWRIPAPASYGTCFYPLVNLALGSGWPIAETPNPSYLWVDYIRVYRRASD